MTKQINQQFVDQLSALREAFLLFQEMELSHSRTMVDRIASELVDLADEIRQEQEKRNERTRDSA